MAVGGCIKTGSERRHLRNFSATYAKTVPIGFHVGNSSISQESLFQLIVNNGLLSVLIGQPVLLFSSLQNRFYDLSSVQKESDRQS